MKDSNQKHKQIRKYKCPICKESSQYKGICFECYAKSKTDKNVLEAIKKHRAKLQANRKYTKGSPIKTFDELLNQKLVYIFCGIKHIEVVKSLQFRTIIDMLNGERIYYAVRKD